jgi:hypothetical protein
MTLLPGWNSIEAAAWVHNLLEKTSLFLIAILAITIGVAYLYGHRRDYLSDEATRAAEAARHATPVERKAELVPNPAPSPEIQSPAAANQPVTEEKTLPGAGGQSPAGKPQAPVTERQPLAEEESQRAQDDREKRSAPQSASRKEPATGVKNAAGIEIRKSNDLGGPQARRHLSADQKARLHAFLKDQPKGRLLIRIIPSVPDAGNYGIELARFFKHEAGWTVRVDNSPFTGTDLGGMWLALRSADAIPPAPGALHAALAHAHVPVRPQPVWDPGGPAFNEIWLVIGRKA